MRKSYVTLATSGTTILLIVAALAWTGAVPAARADAAAATAATAPAGNGSNDAAAFETTVLPLVSRYCYVCHGDGATSGDLALDAFKTAADVNRARDTWKKVI